MAEDPTPHDPTSPAETPTPSSPETPDAGDSMPLGRWIALFAIAVLILVGFSLVAWWMIDNAGPGVSGKTWDRRLIVYSGIEAVAFAAVGWLFGREVHRSEVTTAKEQGAAAKQDAETAKQQAAVATDEAKDRAVEAAEERTKGRALAAAVRSSAASAPQVPEHMREQLQGVTGASMGAQQSQLQSLLDLVDEMYPASGHAPRS